MKRVYYYHAKTLDASGMVVCNCMVQLYEDRQRSAGEIVEDWKGNRLKIDWCINPAPLREAR